MSNTSSRRFIVARQGESVVIREIGPEQEVLTSFEHNAAWAFANRLAQPAKSAQDRRRRVAAEIVFMGLDGMSTVVQTAQATQDALQATNRQARAEATPEPEPKAAVKWVDQDERNARVVTHLRKLNLDGKLNDFTYSLLDQYERKGSLTERQRDAILRNLDQQRQEQPAAANVEVPAGRYAVRMREGDVVVTRFYRVDRPTEGRWEGYTFVKIQAGDDLWPVKDRRQRQEILEVIAADPKAAMLLYGQEIGSCGHCGRTLTDEQSREDGIGPVCKGRLGW